MATSTSFTKQTKHTTNIHKPGDLVWPICFQLTAGDEQLQLSDFLERFFQAAGERKRPRLAPEKNPCLGATGERDTLVTKVGCLETCLDLW